MTRRFPRRTPFYASPPGTMWLQVLKRVGAPLEALQRVVLAGLLKHFHKVLFPVTLAPSLQSLV